VAPGRICCRRVSMEEASSAKRRRRQECEGW
jgi:hypothetical protein